MNVTPLAPQRLRRWALLTPGWRTLDVTTEAGTDRYVGAGACYDALEALGRSGRTLYVAGHLSQLRHTTGATAWEAKVWRGRATAMTLAGTRCHVTSLRSTIETPVELTRCLQWLGSVGVAAGSLSAMAWSLWRRTLGRPLSLSSHPSVGRGAFYGGRQEVRAKGPGEYRHMVSADITAAYATAMASRPYALRLNRVDPTTTIDAGVAGLAEATVYVPNETAFAPLPYRLGPEMIQFPTGHVTGIWPWCELAATIALGYEVKVKRAWAPATEADLFGAWWGVVSEGRGLGGGAARLAKAIANTAWGMFAMVGNDRSVVRWTDDIGDRSYTVSMAPLTKLPQSRTAHVAAETAGRVRARMLLEALYGGGAPPVHIDTDGMLVRKSSPLPEPAGERPGEWRIKTAMARVEIRAPQCYRYKCARACPACTGPDWHYVTAGMGPEAARGVFEKLARGTRHGILGLDMCLPSHNSMEVDKSRADAREALSFASLAFGPGLGTI